MRTSIKTNEKTLVLTIYNYIINVERSLCTLKSDLDLRPVFHKTDDATQAHLHLELLVYRIANTLRYQLHQKDIKSEWLEILKSMNTQKCI